MDNQRILCFNSRECKRKKILKYIQEQEENDKLEDGKKQESLLYRRQLVKWYCEIPPLAEPEKYSEGVKVRSSFEMWVVNLGFRIEYQLKQSYWNTKFYSTLSVDYDGLLI